VEVHTYNPTTQEVEASHKFEGCWGNLRRLSLPIQKNPQTNKLHKTKQNKQTKKRAGNVASVVEHLSSRSEVLKNKNKTKKTPKSKQAYRNQRRFF
jgi:hypothetical protein